MRKMMFEYKNKAMRKGMPKIVIIVNIVIK